MAARKPLIAGNWKMNLNHLEAIALVQKIAFALPAKYFEKVDVTVIPPFTDIRSVQTVVDGVVARLLEGQDVHDDVTVLALRYVGGQPVVVGGDEGGSGRGEGRPDVSE